MQQPPPPPQQPTQPQYGGQVPPAQSTNGMAVAALVFGILGLTILFGIGSVIALILGYVARGQIKRSQGLEGGSGLAITGIVLGWIGTIISIVGIVLLTAGTIALFGWTQSEDFEDVVGRGVDFIAEESVEDISEAEAECTPVQRYPDMGTDHIRRGESHEPYNSSPPTSGPHYALPAEAGVYPPDSDIELETLVHNLEHGQIVIWYRPDLDELDFLERQVVALVNQDPSATVGVPYPDMAEGYNLVITAWTRSRSCVNASQDIVDAFRRRFQGKGPEPLTPPFDG